MKKLKMIKKATALLLSCLMIAAYTPLDAKTSGNIRNFIISASAKGVYPYR